MKIEGVRIKQDGRGGGGWHDQLSLVKIEGMRIKQDGRGGGGMISCL